MTVKTKLVLKRGKERSIQRFHPWIFSGAFQAIPNNLSEGDLVEVSSQDGSFLCWGYFGKGSIAVRVLSFSDNNPDLDFWVYKIQSAWLLRENLGLVSNKKTNCFRLLHAEGDGVPGLIIDFYNGVCVIQTHTKGIQNFRELIATALQNVLGNNLVAIYDKSNETMHGGSSIENEYLFGNQTDGIVSENGLLFKANWENGQKTGFFLDQRQNRNILKKYAEGRNVLNTFSYTGGFSVYALAGNAKLVHSVDVSKNAIALAEDNVNLNFKNANHEGFAIDTFKFFKESDTKYDLIVLDPPAFAKNISARHNAVMGYKRLNAEAIKRIEKGGIIFTFSCSQVVDKHMFYQTIFSAAIESGRNIKVLERLSQPNDHPVSIYHPEGEYLKGLILYVE